MCRLISHVKNPSDDESYCQVTPHIHLKDLTTYRSQCIFCALIQFTFLFNVDEEPQKFIACLISMLATYYLKVIVTLASNVAGLLIVNATVTH